MGDKEFHQHRIHAQMKVIKRVLRYFARKREIRMEKRKILGERIDFDNIVSSAFHAKELYDELKTVCHPDRFQERGAIAKATELFQAVTQNKGNYGELLKLKERIYNELPIKRR